MPSSMSLIARRSTDALHATPVRSVETVNTQDESGPWRQALERLASIVAPISLITASLYYFGWARSEAIASVFGYDIDMLGLTTSDYLLRSVTPMFLPIVLMFVCASMLPLLGKWFRNQLTRRSSSVAPITLAARVLCIIAVATIAVGTVSMGSKPMWATSALLVVGAALAGGGMFMNRTTHTMTFDQPHPPMPLIVPTALLIVGLTGLFLGIASYASYVGRQSAFHTIRNVPDLSDAIVFSTRNLHLTGSSVRCTTIDDDDSAAFRYRYDGLKLFAETTGKLILLPSDYGRNGVAEIMFIPVNEDVRVDISVATRYEGELPPLPTTARPCRGQ